MNIKFFLKKKLVSSFTIVMLIKWKLYKKITFWSFDKISKAIFTKIQTSLTKKKSYLNLIQNKNRYTIKSYCIALLSFLLNKKIAPFDI